MRIECDVAAPLEAAWHALASLEPRRATVAAGPLRFAGTARLEEADDDERTATLRVQAGEVGGHATAMATVRVALSPAGDESHLTLVATVHTGPGATLPDGAAAAALHRLATDLAAALADPAAPRRPAPSWAAAPSALPPAPPAPPRPAGPPSPALRPSPERPAPPSPPRPTPEPAPAPVPPPGAAPAPAASPVAPARPVAPLPSPGAAPAPAASRGAPAPASRAVERRRTVALAGAAFAAGLAAGRLLRGRR